MIPVLIVVGGFICLAVLLAALVALLYGLVFFGIAALVAIRLARKLISGATYMLVVLYIRFGAYAAMALSVLFVIFMMIFAADKAHAEYVRVSWYRMGSHTASGERFKPNGMTAAHRHLPFGSKVKLTLHGKSVVVTINDRGPFIKGREYDVSMGVARALGITSRGVATVDAQVIRKGKK